MTSYVRADLRRLVETRASRACEYCLIHADDTYFGCQVEHIIAEKHGGLTDEANLAYACAFCNRAKGSDVGTVTSAGQFVRFFNPRIDRWDDHFLLQGVLIKSRTSIGEATVRILRFNTAARLLERQTLRHIQRYPPQERASHLDENAT